MQKEGFYIRLSTWNGPEPNVKPQPHKLESAMVSLEDLVKEWLKMDQVSILRRFYNYLNSR